MKLRRILIALTAIAITPAIFAQNAQAAQPIQFHVVVDNAFIHSDKVNGADRPQLFNGQDTIEVDGSVIIRDSGEAIGYGPLNNLAFEYGHNGREWLYCEGVITAGQTLQVTGSGVYPNDPFVCSIK